MRLKRLLGIVALASATFAGTACHVETTKDAMASWVGHDANQLIEKWGPPNRTFVMPNGNTMYTWEWSRTSGYANGHVVTTTTNVCEKTFTVNTEGIVIAWRYRNC